MKTPRSWPLFVLAAPATVAVWSGWVGLGEMTGFGVVHPLPGIADHIRLNTAITLPVGVEAYAAYALGTWLTRDTVTTEARGFAKWSAIGALILGACGQIAYHLLLAAGYDHAPWEITTLVACFPVLVVGMGATLAHLVHRSFATPTPTPAPTPMATVPMRRGGNTWILEPEDPFDEVELPVRRRLVVAEHPVICSGPRGVLFLRRPTPKPLPKRPLNSDLAAPAGTSITLIEDYLGSQHSPVVYLVTNGDRVKIGTTQSLRNRIRRLCLRVDDIALLLHGGEGYEKELHARFADLRIADTEWFEMADELAAFVATGGDPVGAPTGDVAVASSAPPVGDNGTEPLATTGDSAKSVLGDSATPELSPTQAEEVATAPRQRQPRPAARKSGRRTKDDWVELAGPVFHAEFERLRRQPTAYEFKQAIQKAGLGKVSESTAKNIRAEILDRAPLPSLND